MEPDLRLPITRQSQRTMTEDQLEQEVMGWLAEVGYRTVCGYDG
ncbi:hypothetical protein [Aeromonas sp. QDB25]|nr:hypothetical protein [Aeromonas sp. QDB25]